MKCRCVARKIASCNSALWVVYMGRASPVTQANSRNEVLITATTDTQNDISKRNWLDKKMTWRGYVVLDRDSRVNTD